MKILAKLLNLIALLLSVVWLTKSPDWEPAITITVLLASYLGQEFYPFLKKTTRDKELVKKLLSDLPSNCGSIIFLRDHNLGLSFRDDSLKELDNFLYSWYDAEHEFLNKGIEKKKLQFYNKAMEFRSKLSLSIFPHDGLRGFFTMGLKDFETDTKKLELKDKLNKEATEVYKLHQNLVRVLNRII